MEEMIKYFRGAICILLLCCYNDSVCQEQIDIQRQLALIQNELSQDSTELISLAKYFSNCKCMAIDSTKNIRKNQPDYKRIRDILQSLIPYSSSLEKNDVLKLYNQFLKGYRSEFVGFYEDFNVNCNYDSGSNTDCKGPPPLIDVMAWFEGLLFSISDKNKSGKFLFEESRRLDAWQYQLGSKRQAEFLDSFSIHCPLYSEEFSRLGGRQGAALYRQAFPNKIKPYVFQFINTFKWNDTLSNEYKIDRNFVKYFVKKFYRDNFDSRIEGVIKRDIESWVEHKNGVYILFHILPQITDPELVQSITYELIYNTSLNKSLYGTYRPDQNKVYMDKLFNQTEHKAVIRKVVVQEIIAHLGDEDNPAIRHIQYFNDSENITFLLECLGYRETSISNKKKIADTILFFYNSKKI